MSQVQTLQEYLVTLGVQLDTQNMAKLENFLKDSRVQAAMFSAALVAAGKVIYNFIRDNTAYEQALVETAKKEKKSVETVRAHENALKSMGKTMDEIKKNENLKKIYDDLVKVNKEMALPNLKGLLSTVYELQGEFYTLRSTIQYGMQWINYYLLQDLMEPIKKIIETIREAREKLQKNLKQITRQISLYISTFAKGLLGIIEAAKTIYSWFDRLPDGIKSATTALLTMFAIIKSGPLGQILTLIEAVGGLIHDWENYDYNKGEMGKHGLSEEEQKELYNKENKYFDEKGYLTDAGRDWLKSKGFSDDELPNIVNTAFSGLWDVLGDNEKTLSEKMTGISSLIAGALVPNAETVAANIAAWLTENKDTIAEGFSTLGEIVSTALLSAGTIVNAITEAVDTILGDTELMTDIGSTLATLFSTACQTAGKVGAGLVGGIAIALGAVTKEEWEAQINNTEGGANSWVGALGSALMAALAGANLGTAVAVGLATLIGNNLQTDENENITGLEFDPEELKGAALALWKTFLSAFDRIGDMSGDFIAALAQVAVGAFTGEGGEEAASKKWEAALKDNPIIKGIGTALIALIALPSMGIGGAVILGILQAVQQSQSLTDPDGNPVEVSTALSEGLTKLFGLMDFGAVLTDAVRGFTGIASAVVQGIASALTEATLGEEESKKIWEKVGKNNSWLAGIGTAITAAIAAPGLGIGGALIAGIVAAIADNKLNGEEGDGASLWSDLSNLFEGFGPAIETAVSQVTGLAASVVKGIGEALLSGNSDLAGAWDGIREDNSWLAGIGAAIMGAVSGMPLGESLITGIITAVVSNLTGNSGESLWEEASEFSDIFTGLAPAIQKGVSQLSTLAGSFVTGIVQALTRGLISESEYEDLWGQLGSENVWLSGLGTAIIAALAIPGLGIPGALVAGIVGAVSAANGDEEIIWGDLSGLTSGFLDALGLAITGISGLAGRVVTSIVKAITDSTMGEAKSEKLWEKVGENNAWLSGLGAALTAGLAMPNLGIAGALVAGILGAVTTAQADGSNLWSDLGDLLNGFGPALKEGIQGVTGLANELIAGIWGAVSTLFSDKSAEDAANEWKAVFGSDNVWATGLLTAVGLAISGAGGGASVLGGIAGALLAALSSKEGIGKAADDLRAAGEKIFAEIGVGLANVKSWWDGPDSKPFKDAMGEIGNSIVDFLFGAEDKDKDSETYGKRVGGILREAISTAGGLTNALAASIAGLLTGMSADDWTTAFGNNNTWVTGLVTALGLKISGKSNGVTIIGGIAAAIADAFASTDDPDGALNKLAEDGKKIWDQIALGLNNVIDWWNGPESDDFKNSLNQIGNDIVDFLFGAKDENPDSETYGQRVGGIWDKIKAIVEEITQSEWFQTITQKIQESFVEGFNGIWEQVEPILNVLWGNVLASVPNWMKKLLGIEDITFTVKNDDGTTTRYNSGGGELTYQNVTGEGGTTIDDVLKAYGIGEIGPDGSFVINDDWLKVPERGGMTGGYTGRFVTDPLFSGFGKLLTGLVQNGDMTTLQYALEQYNMFKNANDGKGDKTGLLSWLADFTLNGAKVPEGWKPTITIKPNITHDDLQNAVNDAGPVTVPTKGGGDSDEPGKAWGGRVEGDLLTRVGEDGPEYIIPITKPERASQLIAQMLGEMGSSAVKRIMSMFGMDGGSGTIGGSLEGLAAALSGANVVINNTNNVSAPVTLYVYGGGSAQEVGNTAYNMALRHQIRAVEGVLA